MKNGSEGINDNQNTLNTIKGGKKQHLWISIYNVKTPLSALELAHSYKSSVWAEYGCWKELTGNQWKER